METLSRKERERLARENEIIEAAHKVFCERGYNETSMDEIAKNAQFTKRTVYQYFANKEDLYFAVVINGYRRLYESVKKEWEKKNTGFMKMYHSCMAYYDFYMSYPEVIRLTNYAGYVKKRTEGENPRRDELSKFDNAMFKGAAAVIEEGKKDGSIRPDLDSDMAACSVNNMITGFFNQLSITGETFTAHFKLEFKKFVPIH